MGVCGRAAGSWLAGAPVSGRNDGPRGWPLLSASHSIPFSCAALAGGLMVLVTCETQRPFIRTKQIWICFQYVLAVKFQRPGSSLELSLLFCSTFEGLDERDNIC